jgi:hypothetical protein
MECCRIFECWTFARRERGEVRLYGGDYVYEMKGIEGWENVSECHPWDEGGRGRGREGTRY